MTNSDPSLLEITRLSKRFTGTLALDAVDFDVRRGEVHALLGENGAGKSTLIKVLAGVYRADQGEIRLNGRVVDPTTEKLPITFIHQDLGLVDTMTVAENIAVLAGYPRRGGIISWRAARDAAVTALARMGGGVSPDARVRDLPAAERSIVAIARAMAVECDLLVLDEPTAALPEADVARLLDVLRRLRAEGLGIVYVTHRLDEVFRISDRVTVLRDGRRIATDAVAETTPAELVYNIVGRSLSDLFIKPSATAAETVLTVDDLTVGDVGPVSFKVAAGEIVGLVGLRGAGHDTVGRAIFGDIGSTSGSISLLGSPLTASRAARRDQKTHRLRLQQARRGEPRAEPDGQGEPLHQPGDDRNEASCSDRPGRRAGAMPARPASLFRASAGDGARHRHAVGRQPAEGDRGAVDGGGKPPACPRGADLRRRCRLQGGYLSAACRRRSTRDSPCC